MAMTQEEFDTKEYIIDYLDDEGYSTYAKIFSKLDLHLTNDPNTIGFMTPKDGAITVNRNLDENQFSMIIRHEILHGYLQHEKRLIKHVFSKLHNGEKIEDADELTINEIKKIIYSDSKFNIAGDYEISNRGYTVQDKKNARAILLNGEVLSGLVTEDKHPDWVDLSIEEMYDKLEEEMSKEPDMPQESDNSDDDSNDDEKGNDHGTPGTGGTSGPSDKNNSDNNINNSDDESQQNNADDDSEGAGGNSNNSGRSRVAGRLIDEHTFVDLDGNIITFD